jgi:hypothetical protein
MRTKTPSAIQTPRELYRHLTGLKLSQLFTTSCSRSQRESRLNRLLDDRPSVGEQFDTAFLTGDSQKSNERQEHGHLWLVFA